jgi:hypothetical protein
MRNNYKVISWDFAAGRGLVTDGTAFEGKLQTVVVTQADIADDPYLQGFLSVGEVISAEEDMNRCADRKLTEILVENGSRSIPARMDLKPREPVQPAFNPEPPPQPKFRDTMFPTWSDFEELQRRLDVLESITFGESA